MQQRQLAALLNAMVTCTLLDDLRAAHFSSMPLVQHCYTVGILPDRGTSQDGTRDRRRSRRGASSTPRHCSLAWHGSCGDRPRCSPAS